MACWGVLVNIRHVRLAYKPYFFSQRIVFFSHNKSANNTFGHGLSTKRTWHIIDIETHDVYIYVQLWFVIVQNSKSRLLHPLLSRYCSGGDLGFLLSIPFPPSQVAGERQASPTVLSFHYMKVLDGTRISIDRWLLSFHPSSFITTTSLSLIPVDGGWEES